MDDPLAYENRHVVVTGAASGMGAATARILVDLGAHVTGLDVKAIDAPVASTIDVDLRDPASIDAAVDAVEGTVDHVFSCAGLPGPPFSELDTMLVNFVGARHLIQGLLPRLADADASIGCISSAGAAGWQEHIPVLEQLLATQSFSEAKAWLEANEDTWGWSGYLWSKYAIDAWVCSYGADLMRRGVRLNCINPGPTDTPMMPAFHELAGKEMIDSALGPIGRYSTPEEQAWPLVLLNSPRMSYVAGEVLWTDGGFFGSLTMGKHGGFGDGQID
ncbi:MAG: SDR family oxidoreductase [Acidimicrobiia bacterium]|nr:SDR family oxidoreductase [Acidimicrobiia bacterium]